MATPKSAILEVVSKQPDEVSWDDLMYRIYVREKLERALVEADAGKFIDHDEVFAELLQDDDE